jgi:hypothetical protein
MNLEFNAGKVDAIEQETKLSVTELMSKLSVSTLALFIKHGMNLENREKALEMIDTYIAEKDTDMYALYMDVMEALQKAGFFMKKVPIQSMRDRMEQGVQESISSLEQSGEKENLPQ